MPNTNEIIENRKCKQQTYHAMTCGTPFCISDLWCIGHSGQIGKGEEGLVIHLVNVDIGSGGVSPLLNMDSEYTGYIATMSISLFFIHTLVTLDHNMRNFPSADISKLDTSNCSLSITF